MSSNSLPEVPTIEDDDTFLRGRGSGEQAAARRATRRAAGSEAASVESIAAGSSAAIPAAPVVGSPRSAAEAAPIATSTARLAAPAARQVPRTIERALLELALVPEAGWTSEQAEGFRAAATQAKRSPADVVQLIGFLRSRSALPRTAAAARFACELLASNSSVADLEQALGGVWSYTRRRRGDGFAPIDAAAEARLVAAVLGNPRPAAQVHLVLDAVDNEGGFAAYRSDLRLRAMEIALRTGVSPQDIAQWALDAREIGIDDAADVSVFVRLLTQH